MKERMKMLLKAGVISQCAHNIALMATEALEKEWVVDIQSDQVQMAMTHFARAIDRIQLGNEISEGLDSEIFAEIKEDECYPLIQAMNKKLCDFTKIETIPDAENSFFISNLYAMYLERT
ncbi:PRD domain-containing protein [Vibrio comitans]|nr:PRD domain-containing protein [Vibrio comitans]